MDDDWSEEEEEIKEEETIEAPLGNHVDEHPLAPHLLESAALGRFAEKPEETIIVSKNERFADVTYDRRDTRSPDQNLHGQRQIYNPKLGRFEEVTSSAGREQERNSNRRNVEIMQRNGGRRDSTGGGRRDSFARNDENRQRRGSYENKFSPTTQRRASIAERDPTAAVHLRRDSFISNSAFSDADRSLSNASPSVDTQVPEHMQGIDLLALQAQQMADSRKRAMERRAKDEENRLLIAERAHKKAAELAALSSSASRPSSTKTETPKASPVPPAAKPAVNTDDAASKPGMTRSDSGVWTANRDQEEIIRKDSPLKEESTPKRSAWGVIGSQAGGSQSGTTSHKNLQNGMFNNPNTLAAINHAIGGDAPRRGRNQPRPPRAPVNPTNVPPSLQGWAAFAGSLETRKLHDNERQEERNRERERLDKEKGNSEQRSANLVDKWKRVEIKEPENAGDVAGRTVVSVLKSGYVEDSSGKIEVRELPVPGKSRSDTGGNSPGTSKNMPTDGSSSLSPAMSSTTPGLGIQSPTPSALGDKTPGSRDRSRFFPSPSSVVDTSPRLVHPIQSPLHSDRPGFPPPLFSAFDDLAKSPSTISTLPASQRQHMSQYGHHNFQMSPGQGLAAAPQIGGLTPRTAFSHTIPMTSPPPPAAQKPIKFPSLTDIDNVLSRIRESMQTSSLQESSESSTKESTKPTQHENIPQVTVKMVEPTSFDPQTQTRTDSIPQDSGMKNYLKISAISPHRDLQISTRDVDDDFTPKPRVKVSLPKQFYTSSRETDIPIETTSRPKINLPPQVAECTATPDAKSRIKAIDREFPAKPMGPRNNPYPANWAQHGFKINFSPSLRPRGNVVPHLIKKDKGNYPYVNFVAPNTSLALPSYAHENETIYAGRHSEVGPKKKWTKNNKFTNRKPSKGETLGHTGKEVAGSSRPEKK